MRRNDARTFPNEEGIDLKEDRQKTSRRILTGREFRAIFAPGELKDFDRLSKSMGPFEPDPSNRTPEAEAWLDRWVGGYCASGHDPNYTSPDDK